MIVWKKLGEFATVQKSKNKNHITENAYSITQGGLVPTRSFFKGKTNVTSSNTSGYYIVEKDWFVYSPSRIDVGSISYLKDEGPVIVSPIDVVFSIDKNVCLPDYLLHYILTHEGMRKILRYREGVEGTGRRNLPFDAIQKVEIPIPTLDKQRVIVEELSDFVSLISNLEEEIAFRKQQFGYYRNQVLNPVDKDGYKLLSLGELGTFTRGNGIQKSDFVENGEPCIHYGQVHTKYGITANKVVSYISEELYKKCKKAKHGDIVLATTSEDVEAVCKPVAWLGNKEIAISTDAYIYRHDCNPVFIANQFLTDRYFSFKASHVTGAKVIRISDKAMSQYQIYLPSRDKQDEIGANLSTFAILISHLEEERDLRKKQFEYYREQLLNFE